MNTPQPPDTGARERPVPETNAVAVCGEASQQDYDRLHEFAASKEQELAEARERIDWLEGQREVAIQERDNALNESRELLAEKEAQAEEIGRLRTVLKQVDSLIKNWAGGASPAVIVQAQDIVMAVLEKEALSASSGEGVSPWRPIETAPRDTLVWCFDPEESPSQFVGSQVRHNKFVKNDRGSWDTLPDKYKWSWHESDSLTPCNPTHWMPLPKAPDLKAANGAGVVG